MTNIEEKLCQSAAKKLITSLDSLQSMHFTSNKFPDELITVLSKLNLTEQSFLVKRAQRYLAVSINLAALERQLQELENQRDEQELEDTYLLHGAPLALMRRLFGMHASEFSRRRHILNIRGVGNGRPPACDEATEHRLWTLWQTHQLLEERQRFLKLVDETALDLHLIWSALRDHIDN